MVVSAVSGIHGGLGTYLLWIRGDWYTLKGTGIMRTMQGKCFAFLGALQDNEWSQGCKTFFLVFPRLLGLFQPPWLW